MMLLSALEARAGNLQLALSIMQDVARDHSEAVEARSMEFALLRALLRRSEAASQLALWLRRDPTNSILRCEAIALSKSDPDLFAHLAADLERILTGYMRLGLYKYALGGAFAPVSLRTGSCRRTGRATLQLVSYNRLLSWLLPSCCRPR
jgi:hypothetical protein